jgi:hypothetical protein
MKQMILLLAGLLFVVISAQASEDNAKSVKLFNGQDLTGWVPYVSDPAVSASQVWQVKNGVIHCVGVPAGYLRTAADYENYSLRVEWCWTEKPSNSGVLLHVTGENKIWPTSIESQLQHENAGDFWVIGGTTFSEHTNKEDSHVAKKQPSNEKPAGEWNTMMVYCDKDSIRVLVNGLLQNEATQTSVKRGGIALQSEGAPIEFRNIVLTPLE